MTLVLDRDPPLAVMSQGQGTTDRLKAERQTLDEMYQPPSKKPKKTKCSYLLSILILIFLFFKISANFLEIEVCKPFTHSDEKGRKKFTDYEVLYISA